ncbi:MAG TPA: hypothetical protein GX728_05795 [Clostridiaceae bacterium]|nr:hypothetical protein [Clostridiaceae bacterium]
MMDYLEGFLIGPIWSDTDYRTRRHYFAHVFLATLMGAAFTIFLFFSDAMSKWVFVPYPLSLVLLIVLMLATPLISSIYYRVPFFVRPFLLILYAMKYILLFYTLVHIFFPLVTVDKMKLPAFLLERVDDHMTRSIDRFGDSGRVLTTVAGVLVGAFWIIAEGLLVVLILIAVPLAAILLLKGVRQALDIGLYELIDRFIMRGRPATIEDIPWLGNVADDTEKEKTVSLSKPFAERREHRLNEVADDVPHDEEDAWGSLESEIEKSETVRFVPVPEVDEVCVPEFPVDQEEAAQEELDTDTVNTVRFRPVREDDEVEAPELPIVVEDPVQEERQTETAKAAPLSPIKEDDEVVVPESSGDRDELVQATSEVETVVTDKKPDEAYRESSVNKFRIVDKLRFVRDGYHDTFTRKGKPGAQEPMAAETEREERELREN